MRFYAKTEAGQRPPQWVRGGWWDCSADQGFAVASDWRQSQPAVPQVQEVAQVQTGVQLQLQFWPVQAALDEMMDWEGFFFMDDLVSSLSTEPFPRSYTLPIANWGLPLMGFGQRPNLGGVASADRLLRD